MERTLIRDAKKKIGDRVCLARLLAALLNQKSIREVVFLHRGPNRLIP